jgi:hypothetical protein
VCSVLCRHASLVRPAFVADVASGETRGAKDGVRAACARVRSWFLALAQSRSFRLFLFFSKKALDGPKEGNGTPSHHARCRSLHVHFSNALLVLYTGCMPRGGSGGWRERCINTITHGTDKCRRRAAARLARCRRQERRTILHV